MPCVLWGVACISLPEPTTTGDVVREFRRALSPYAAQEHDKFQPRVDLYRLVPIADEDGAHRLSGEERVIAHLPDSNFSCAEIEDICMQRDDAELRCNRISETLAALNNSMDSDEECSSPSQQQNNGGKQRNMLEMLRQENQFLRCKLDQSDVLLKEQQETAAMLHREFKMLIHEVMPIGSTMPAMQALAPQVPRHYAGPELGGGVAPGGGEMAPLAQKPLQARAMVPRIGGLGGIAAAISGPPTTAASVQGIVSGGNSGPSSQYPPAAGGGVGDTSFSGRSPGVGAASTDSSSLASERSPSLGQPSPPRANFAPAYNESLPSTLPAAF